MAALLYFLPGVHQGEIALEAGRLNQRLIAERGLGHVFADCEGVQADCTLSALAGRGPGGQSGVILSALPGTGDAPPRRLGYYPNEQTWHEFAGGKYWIGLDTADRPRPQDLARRQQFPGHWVRLADGQDWLVPIIRKHGGGTNLPCALGWNGTGKFEMKIKAAYRKAWDDSAETARLYWDPQSDGTIDLEVALLRALDALALNYRVGRAEQSVLELIDTPNWQQVLGATIDWPTIRRAYEDLKKKEASQPTPDSPSSTPGGGASCPDTAPAAATCSSPG
jgi:hypothetical protein